jgi:hypothetical protein
VHRQHEVSRFHLAHFTDPGGTAMEPFLWLGDCATGNVSRRAPKNIGWKRGLYAAAEHDGGDAPLEAYLATRIETHAARELVGLSSANDPPTDLPNALVRYLAFAAARSSPMRDLVLRWIDQTADGVLVEPPPAGWEGVRRASRGIRMQKAGEGARLAHEPDEAEALRRAGWTWDMSDQDFSEYVRFQAWYLQVRFFPRLQWHSLVPPVGDSFIIGDRPVVWGFDGWLDAPPSMFRHPSVQLVAPLTRSFALFAHHADATTPDRVLPVEINRIIALAAQQWIAGSCEQTVRAALEWRSQSHIAG